MVCDYLYLNCRKEIEDMMAIVVKGDAMDKESLKKAFDSIEDVDAVVSTIGGTPADPSVDSQVLLLSHAFLSFPFSFSFLLPSLFCLSPLHTSLSLFPSNCSSYPVHTALDAT